MKIITKILIYPLCEHKTNLVKKNRNFKYKNIKKINFNYSYLIIPFFIFINLTFINTIFSKERLYFYKKLNLVSEITMKISLTGNQQILSEIYNDELPDKIYVNNIETNGKSKIVKLDENENTIKLVWNSPIHLCNGMFYQLSNINEIDLSKFDTSLITDMSSMFYGCYSLSSINFHNFNTSKVTSMFAMFFNCSLLTSLDLNYFDTSSVTNMIGIFHNCISLKYLKIDFFNTSSVNNMNALFYNCKSLTSLELSNFDTSLVTNMNCMFGECKLLFSLNLKNFNTGLVTDMEGMFTGCSSLVSLNLSSFDASKVTTIKGMFYDCSSLIFLDVNSLIEPKNQNIDFENAFKNINRQLFLCVDIEKNNNIKLILQRDNLLNNNDCQDSCFLENMKLSINVKGCIVDCSYSSYNELYEYNNICYSECPENTYISPDNEYLCLKKLNCEQYNKYYNYENTSCINNIPQGYYVNDKIKKTIDKCHSDCKECEEKYNDKSSNCKSCLNNAYFLDLGNCVSSCSNDEYYIDSSGNKICKCPNNKCKECSYESNELDLCISCSEGYYQKIDDKPNNKSFIYCYKNPDGYYLDDDIYKPCYNTCKSCIELGDENDNKCIECIDGYSKLENNNNCYENCIYYHYFDLSNKRKCTLEEKCPNDQNKLIKEKKLCLKDCSDDDIYKCEKNNICYESCPEESNISEETNKSDKINKSNEINTSNDINKSEDVIENKEELIKSEEINKSDASKNSDISKNNNIEKECPKDMPYKNQNNECIKECNSTNFFNEICKISNNNPITQQDIIRNIKAQLSNGTLDSLLLGLTEGQKKDLLIKSKDITFQITTTDNQNNNNYTNISTIKLGECEDKLKKHYEIDDNKTLLIFKIDYYVPGLSIPVIGYEVYHPDSKIKLDLKTYCKDILIDFDIPASIDENNLDKYDPNSEYYTNECVPSTSDNGTDIILNDRKEEFINNNLSLCESKCTYNGYNEDSKKSSCECEIKSKEFIITELFEEENILSNNITFENSSSNIGTMKCVNTLFTKDGLLTNIASYILLFFTFSYMILIILFFKFGMYLISKDIKKIISQIKKNKNNLDKFRVEQKEGIKKKKNKKDKIGNPIDKKKRKSGNKNIKKKELKSVSKIELKNTNILINLLKEPSSQLEIYKTKNKSKNNVKNNNLKLFDSELNSFPYRLALIFDKRTYIKYYISLIKTKHPLIFSFIPNKDYNIVIVKISILLLSFAIYFAINTLFFDKLIIHKIYESEGKYIISYQMLNIIYSFIISHIICSVIKYVSLSERNLLKLKYETSLKDVNIQSDKIRRSLMIKYIIFFITGLVFLIFFWFYLSSFCAVYQNSQVYPFINTLICVLISLLYPFLINLLPGMLRIPSLKKKKNGECLFKISKIIQYI